MEQKPKRPKRPGSPRKKSNTNTASDRAVKNKDEKQWQAAVGEIQYGQTIGRHGTDEETALNPEE